MDTDTSASAVIPVMISKNLYENLENRVKLSNGLFKNVGDYLAFIITEIVKEEPEGASSSVFTKEEDEEIKNRLKNLGYI
jgi:hypothetical protein